MKWNCKYCGCKSDTIQNNCPNGCPKDEQKKGNFEIIRNHKNWCKFKIKGTKCNCGFARLKRQKV